ncbi:MAG: MFS transporter [Mycobacteriaceae bacterium]|nr:MFS transporter [Mycobacteriaceae bacterium]
MFMVTLDNLVVTNALPAIRKDLGASLTDLQWFVDAYILAFASMLLTASALGERLGRRRMFLAGIAVFTAASATCALATEPWILIVTRALQGLGGAAVMPLSLTLLSAAVSEDKRNAAIGIWGGISGLGVAVGPVVGGAVVDGVSWQWIFWINVPFGILALPVAARVLSESFGNNRQLDPLGLALSSAGVLAVVWGVIHGPDGGWTSGAVLGCLLGGAVLLAAFLVWERNTAAPMLPLRLFRSRAFSAINLVMFTFSLGVFGAVFLLAQYLQVAMHYTPLEAGVRIMPWSLAPIVVAPLAGLLADRVGIRALVVTGQLCLTTALAWMATITTTAVHYGAYVPSLVLAGIGMGLTYAPAATVVMATADPADRGMASGANNTIRQVGVAMGVAILASIFASHGGYSSAADFIDGLVPAIYTGASVVSVGACAALLLPGRPRH